MLRQYDTDDLAPLAEQLHQENRHAKRLSLAIVAGTYGALLALLIWQGMDWEGSLGGLVTLVLYTIPFPLIVLERTHRSRRRRTVLQQVRQALLGTAGRGSLEPLLRIRAACRRSFIPDAETSQLRSLCDTHLRQQLPRATESEIHQLSPQARTDLVQLLDATLKSPLFKPGIAQTTISQELQELVVVIFLALATLKHPGAERFARHCLKISQNEAFPEAAREYLTATGQ